MEIGSRESGFSQGEQISAWLEQNSRWISPTQTLEINVFEFESFFGDLLFSTYFFIHIL